MGFHAAVTSSTFGNGQNSANLARLFETQTELGLPPAPPSQLTKEVGCSEDLLRIPLDESQQGVQCITDNEGEGDPGARALLRSARTGSSAHLKGLQSPTCK